MANQTSSSSSSFSSSSSVLLQRGALLLHDDSDHVVPTVADVLIEGSFITRIANHIEPPSADTRIVDVSGKIVGPGYVDTHHHLWQTQNKGAHADQSLLEYLPLGNNTSVFYTARDLFYGQLSGALEAIDGGTTTVVDHAHCNAAPDHRQSFSFFSSFYFFLPSMQTLFY